MLPTAATTVSAAQLTHVFENSAHFIMTLIGDWKRAHPSISLRFSIEKEKTKKTLALRPDWE